MMKNNIDYRIFRHNDYNSEVRKLIRQDGPKLYVIDIDLPSKSGIDMIREIRETDFYSQIIVLSAHEELTSRIFQSRLMILEFISKFDDHEQKLKEAVEYSLKVLGKRNVLKIGTKKNIIFIDVDDILYILKENNDRKCIIKTKDNEFLTGGSLIAVTKDVKHRFIHSHRCCLINPKHVAAIDYDKLLITFKGGQVIQNMISRNYKRGLQKLWN